MKSETSVSFFVALNKLLTHRKQKVIQKDHLFYFPGNLSTQKTGPESPVFRRTDSEKFNCLNYSKLATFT